MATTKDTTKLKKEIESLKLEDAAVEKKIIEGTIPQEEGRQKRDDLGLKIKNLNLDLSTPLEEEEENHDKKKHKKDHVPHGAHKKNEDEKEDKNESSSENESTKIETNNEQASPVPDVFSSAFSDSDTSNLDPTKKPRGTTPVPDVFGDAFKNDAALDPTKPSSVPDVFENAFKNTPLNPSTPTPVPKAFENAFEYAPDGNLNPTALTRKAQAKNVANKTGKTLMYTSPGGFVVGKVAPRVKERLVASERVKQIQEKGKIANIQGKKAGKLTEKSVEKFAYFTSGAWIVGAIKKRIPEKVKTTFKAFVPKKKNKSGDRTYKEAVQETEQKDNPTAKDLTSDLVKKVVPEKVRTKVNKYNPFKHFLKTPEANDAPQPSVSRTKRTAKELQKRWNDTKIGKAIQRGYNRTAVLQRIRTKLLKSKAWKYGKYAAFTPIGGAAIDTQSWRQKRKSNSENSNPITSLYKSATSNTPLQNWTPRTMGNKAWGKYATPRLERLNSRLGAKLGNRTIKGAGKKLAQRAGGKVGQKVATQVALTFFKTPPGWVTLAVIAVFLLLAGVIALITSTMTGGLGNNVSALEGNGSGNETTNPTTNIIPGFTLALTGPPSIDTCENPTSTDCVIEYTISYSYSSSPVPLESITIHNNLPPNTVFESATGDYKQEQGAILWPLDRVNNQSPITIRLKPSTNNIRIVNSVFATSIFVGGSGNLQNILPPTIESSETADAAQQQVVAQIANSPELLASYQAAERSTGVPWQILAGLHFREGSLNPNNSLVSGRPIGENEPDIVRGGGCSSDYISGEPVALPSGGCGFRSFTDSVIYAANHFKGKNGGNSPASFQELAKSLSYYNGGGNANCGKTPYVFCPAQFTGDDDTYVMNYFDKNHEPMYIVYCADFTLCNPPVKDQRPGVASVIMGLNRFYNPQ